MAALSVVELDPRCKGSGAVCVGDENPAIGPFALQRPVVAFAAPMFVKPRRVGCSGQ